jgi:hypothetical protein
VQQVVVTKVDTPAPVSVNMLRREIRWLKACREMRTDHKELQTKARVIGSPERNAILQVGHP